MPGTINFTELQASAQKRRAGLDAQYQAAGYTRIGSKYVKDPNFQTPVDRRLQELSIATAEANLKEKTKPEKDEPLALSDIERLVDDSGNPAPTSLTRADLKTNKYKIDTSTADQRNKKSQLGVVDEVINQIEKYSKKVNTFEAGPGGLVRIIEGTKRAYGAATQTDKNATLLKQQKGKLAQIIRTLGEKGALSEGDVVRAISLIPTVYDTKEIAEQQMIDLRDLISSAKGDTSTDTATSKPNPQPNTDPVAALRQKYQY